MPEKVEEIKKEESVVERIKALIVEMKVDGISIAIKSLTFYFNDNGNVYLNGTAFVGPRAEAIFLAAIGGEE